MQLFRNHKFTLELTRFFSIFAKINQPFLIKLILFEMIKVNITSRHFKAHETLQDYIKNEVETLSKYHEEILHTDVILSFEKSMNSVKNCEIIVKLKDKILTSKESTDDFVKSIDKALDKIEAQILKYKDKHKAEKHDMKKEIIKTV